MRESVSYRQRTLIAMGTAVAAAMLLGGGVARADASGITVGPIRQVLSTSHPAVVQVNSTSDVPVKVTTEYVVSDTAFHFHPAPTIEMAVHPSSFIVKPGRTVTVTITKIGPITDVLAGVAFIFRPVSANGQTEVGATIGAIAQVTIHADKLSSIHPEAPVPPMRTTKATAGAGLAILIGLFLLLMLLLAWRSRKQDQRPKRSVYGF